MSEKIAIITGASRGIGKAIADELAKLGHITIRVARKPFDAENAVTGDVSNPDDAKRIIDETLQRFGRIDVLVNNAGYAPLRAIEEMSNDEWRAVIDTNLSAAFYLTKAVWPIFKKQNAGVIVNISSEASRDPFPGFAAYGAAKAALNLMGKALAREGAAHNIRVHTVAPAAVETQMFRSILSKEKYPAEKTLDPADVARVVAQCVAGDLRHTSGEVIFVHKTA